MLVPTNFHSQFFLPIVKAQEAEIKSTQSLEIQKSKAYSRNLEKMELARLEEILKQSAYPFMPSPKAAAINQTLPPLSFSPELVTNFLTNRLKEEGIIEESSFEIGGGCARYVLAGLEYADVDISYNICKPDYLKIIRFIEAFLIEQIELAGHRLNGDDDLSVRDYYPYRLEYIRNQSNQVICLFIALGGIELKFIADLNYRWNSASCDSFYITLPDRTVHCINNILPGDKLMLEKCTSDLLSHKFVVDKPENVSSLIFRILLFQTQGFEVSKTDIDIAIKQFKRVFPPQAGEKLTAKFHHFLAGHYRKNELPRIFSFLNFLSIIINIEDQKEQETYLQAISTAWLQRTYEIGEERRFMMLADLIQQRPELTRDLLTLIYGVCLYEFTLKNSDVNAYIFDFAGIDKAPRWQISAKQEGATHYLVIFQQSPVELVKSCLSSWIALSSAKIDTECGIIFKDLRFTELPFTPEGQFKMVSQFMESFDQPLLSNLFLTNFLRVNPRNFYEFVNQAMPNKFDGKYLERKNILSDLHCGMEESMFLGDKELEKVVIFIRKRVCDDKYCLTPEDLKTINNMLEGTQRLRLNPKLQNFIVNALIHLIQKVRNSISINLMEEIFHLAYLSERQALFVDEAKSKIWLTLLEICEEVLKSSESPELCKLISLHKMTYDDKAHSNLSSDNIKNLNQLKLRISNSILLTLLNLPNDSLVDTVYPSLEIIVDKHMKSLQANVMKVFERFIDYSADSINPQRDRILGKIALSLYPGDLQKYLDSLLQITNQLISSKDSIEEDETMQEIQKNGFKLLSYLAKCKQESSWHQKIIQMIWKGMAASLVRKSVSQSKQEYIAYLEVLQSIEKLKVEEVNILQSLVKLDFQNGRMNIVKIFLQTLMKIDPSEVKEVQVILDGQLIKEKDKQGMHSSIKMSQFLNSIEFLEGLLVAGKDTSTSQKEFIDLLKASDWSQMNKKDTQRVRKAIYGMMKYLIACSSKSSIIDTGSLFLAIRNSQIMDCNLLDEIAILILQKCLSNGMCNSAEIENALCYANMEGHFVSQACALEIPSLIKSMAPFLKNCDRFSFKILLRALENGLWDKEIENCILIILNEYKKNKPSMFPEIDLINRILISNRSFESISEENFHNFAEVIFLSDGKQFLKPSLISKQMLTSFARLPGSYHTDELLDTVRMILHRSDLLRLYKTPDSEAISLFKSLNAIFDKQKLENQFRKNTFELIARFLLTFLCVERTKPLSTIEISKEVQNLLFALVEKMSTISSEVGTSKLMHKVVFLCLNYLSRLRTMKKDVFIPQIEDDDKQIRLLLQKKCLNDDEIKEMYDCFDDDVMLWAAFDPTRGKELVKNIISKMIKSDVKWIKQADDMLEETIHEGIFNRKTTPGFCQIEMDEKELSECSQDLTPLQCEIIQKACEQNGHWSIALSRLCKLKLIACEANQEVFKMFISSVLAVHDRMLMTTLYSPDKINYCLFRNDFLIPLLNQKMSKKHLEGILDCIRQIISRLEYYPILFGKIIEISKTMEPINEFRTPSEVISYALKNKKLSISENEGKPIKQALKLLQQLNAQEFYYLVNFKTTESLSEFKTELAELIQQAKAQWC